MTNLQPITEAAERRLLRAVSGAVRGCAAGEGPDLALAKAAAAEGLNAEFTRRAAHMLNTARTIRHLVDNRDDGDKRAASFPLTDIGRVLELMAPPAAKAASRPARVPDLASLRPEIEPLAKAAAAEYPGDPDEKYRKVSMHLNAQRRAVELARTRAAAALAKRSAAVDDLAESFRSPASLPFEEFAKRAAARYGSAIVPVLDALRPRVRSFGKRSSLSAAADAFGRFERMLEAVGDAAGARDEWRRAGAELSRREELFKAAHVKRGAKESPPAPGGGLGSWIVPFLSPLLPKEITPRDTGFADRVRAIDAQAQLAGLYAADPVLRRDGPEDFLAVVDQLEQITPGIANKRPLLQAAARYMKEGEPSMFELSQIAQTMNTSNEAQRDRWEPEVRRRERDDESAA
jgi:hypothetical protein